MHFYTSITTNYIPKARILAESVKKNCKDAYFSLVVSDNLPEDFDIQREPFDEIVYPKDLELPVENLNMWIFIHSVVELCTAVKGQAMLNFLKRGISEKIVYLDPDTVVFNDLTGLETLLDTYSVVLTPHLTAPEHDENGILDNEICALQHGIYNIGFLAVSNSENGMMFAEWWRDRLVDYCYDDIPRGLFTDQRWVDLAPAIFSGVYILRETCYNVATWNISNRSVEKHDGHFFVDGKALQFYHFSGFDSGAQEAMLIKYGASNKALLELRNWYIEKQDGFGQKELGQQPSVYAFFSNGEKISMEHRKLLRTREDLLQFFGRTDPFIVTDDYICYYNWYKEENKLLQKENNENEKDKRIIELEAEIRRLRKYLAPAIKIKRFFAK